jgi:two-component system NtrC family response regulator/two-component system response regulator HydG
LITGETGTGKELIAEAIHFRSRRRGGPLIRVNCAAFTETLINSELFGHERGAFTGAVARKTGFFELADAGTIFLDEIGDIPVSTQISLLRVLESGAFQRVGGTQTLKVDTRVICATNKDLAQAVRQNLFRKDLFYRVNVVSIDIPPLRDRKSDIPVLANHFLEKHVAATGKKAVGFSRDAMALLTGYEWPGNVRELINVVERAAIYCKGKEITPDHLRGDIRELKDPKEFRISLSSLSLKEAESTLIRKALNEASWNLKQAARQLSITRSTLYSKMKKHKIQRPT